MTLIAATKLIQNRLYLHADTIRTQELAAGAYFPQGVTSHNEIVNSRYVGSGRDEVYVENACKLGVISENVICAVAGHEDLIFSILEPLRTRVRFAESMEELRNSFDVVAASLCGTPTSSERSAEIMLGFRSRSEGTFVCGATFVARRTGQVEILRKRRFPLSGSDFWQIAEGSGKTLLDGYYPEAIRSTVANDPTLERIAGSMIALDYSNKVRTAANNAVLGVGGAFLHVSLDDQGARYPDDCLHIHSDANGNLNYFVKVSFRNGLFFVTDYIKPSVTVMRSLESEIESRARPQAVRDISDLVSEALRLEAPLILHDARDERAPEIPNVAIVENRTNAIRMNTTGGLPHLPPGSEITLTTAESPRSFRVRST